MAGIQDVSGARRGRQRDRQILGSSISEGFNNIGRAVDEKLEQDGKIMKEETEYFDRYRKALMGADSEEKRQVIRNLHEQGQYGGDPRGQEIFDTIGGVGVTPSWHSTADANIASGVKNYNSRLKETEDRVESFDAPNYVAWEDKNVFNIMGDEEDPEKEEEIRQYFRSGIMDGVGFGTAKTAFQSLGLNVGGVDTSEAEPPPKEDAEPGMMAKLGNALGVGSHGFMGNSSAPPSAAPQSGGPQPSLVQSLGSAPLPSQGGSPLAQGLAPGAPQGGATIIHPGESVPRGQGNPQALGDKPVLGAEGDAVPTWYGSMQQNPAINSKVKSEIDKKRAAGMGWDEILSLLQTHLPQTYKAISGNSGN